MFLTFATPLSLLALETCYKGIVIDPPTSLPPNLPPTKISQTLKSLTPYYQSDMTQPFGLNTPLAKTYVKRCLVGVKGTTYKYLGIRMFASDWKKAGDGGVAKLNDWMEVRTSHHLDELGKSRSYPPCGSNKYTVALINMMTSYDKKDKDNKLKKEPDFGNDRTNVSWHADSSLQNYSTIAVYHCILDEGGDMAEDRDRERDNWRVGLKVVNDAEGPTMNTRGANVSGVASAESSSSLSSARPSDHPKITVALENNATYYLLDDFNHHHQHAVLSPDDKGENKTVRYSR